MKKDKQLDNISQIWMMLLNDRRRKDGATSHNLKNSAETRTEIERDYDRILFSTPVRRLADKTQVFPLDKNDSVRTRLTHSHEVSNLARSIGTALAFEHEIAGSDSRFLRDIPALLAAIGLVHDLGNPPFGHQGEAAIQSWFKDHSNDIFEGEDINFNEQQKQDFLKFEGNAQGFRLVTKLQLLNDNYGLNLTYATLSAMMKYPTSSHNTEETGSAAKKNMDTFFQRWISLKMYRKQLDSILERDILWPSSWKLVTILLMLFWMLRIRLRKDWHHSQI